MPEINTQRLENFVARFTRLIESQPKEAALLTQGRELLHDLVKQDDWLVGGLREPHASHYQQYLLYLDPKERFSVVSFVWGPGQFTPIHDHTVWGLIGMLMGSEKCQPYSRMSDGRWVPAGLQLHLLPGDVEAVSPRLGDVHKVWNAFSDQSSISIHVYGGNIGRISRHVYQLDGQTKEFISGYSPVPSVVSSQAHLVRATQDRAADTARQSLQASVETAAAATSGNGAPSSVSNRDKSLDLTSNLETTHTTASAPSAVKSWMSKKAIDQSSPSIPKSLAMGKGQPEPAKVSAPMSAPSPVPIFSPDPQPMSAANEVPLANAGPAVQTSRSWGASKPSSSLQSELAIQPIAKPQARPASMETTLTVGTTSSMRMPEPTQTRALDEPKAAQAFRPSDEPHAAVSPSAGETPSVSALWVRERLLSRQEVALIDLREEDTFARGHPLFAAQMPLSRLEMDAYRRLPCLTSPIVLYHDEIEITLLAREILLKMGYKAVFLLQDGLRAWQQAALEMFIDVNVPSKAFGELVAAQKHTPHVSATQLKFWLDQNADLVVLDARRFDEYQTMSIPKATSVPGAELVLRARTLAPRVTTRIVVNCAGRTRSIIGAQSLLNAGIPNPVCALENGTIGWVLAGQALESGRDQTYGAVNEVDLSKAKMSALALAIRCGVKRIDLQEFQTMSAEASRTTYLFDVRSAQEFLEGHLPKAIHAAGGQLVQETDHFVPVRGARVVLYDTEGVRAMMSASWLAQMAWEVYVIKDVRPGDLTRKDTRYFEPPQWSGGCPEVTPELLKEWLAQRNNLSLVVDLSSSAHYVKQHIPGAWWLLRSKMKEDFARVHKANRYILTSEDGLSARFAWAELRSCVKPNVEIFVLVGGTKAWSDKGFSLQQGESYLASARIDRYQRPYEGVQNSAQAMQAYLDWEYGLVEQLRKDATHFFRVV